MSTVPTGTVTFLFTDIEGSTKLLDQLREQYITLLEEHHDLLRLAISHWNGREIDTQGDAFFVAFGKAIDAVNCVMEAQRLLAAHTWPEEVSVRVRMGLHTGEPLMARVGYVGMDVHRAARIASAGYGGQVLISQTTRELIHQDLPKDASLRDLGEHKLKDIRFPQHIYQLDIEGLPSDFPPLKTLSAIEEPPAPGEAPYKGLQYFDEQDATWFFGREQITARLVETVNNQQFLAVIGASGSGKSSVVRAGLLPVLKNKKSGKWQIFVFTPTAHPLETLAINLTRQAESISATTDLMDKMMLDPRSLHLFIQRSLKSSRNTNILLLVDQFEELFTQCHELAERQAFIDNLLGTIQDKTATTHIVLTLRADFYEHVARYPALRELVSSHQIYIGAMSSAELRQAIEEPATRGGWELSAGLSDLILHDIGASEGHQAEPGALPLLSHALLETWRRRRGNQMTLRAYTEAGGVQRAIAHTADRVYFQELTTTQQGIARGIFLRLTELGEGAQDTRRRISIHELIPPGPAGETEQIREVLLKLADARLITTDRDTLEVAHEALIREWPAIREWLSQDREGLQLHRRLTEATQEWELLERDPGALYRGVHLAQAMEWALNNPTHLNAMEQAFITSSKENVEREEAEREAQRQRELEAAQRELKATQKLAETERHAARRIRTRAWLLSGVLLVTIAIAVFAVYQRQNSLRQSAILLAGQAETELANGYHDRAVLLALAALENYPYTSQAEHALGQAVSYSRAMQQYTSHKTAVTSVAWSPDGKRVASTASTDNNVHIWDPVTGKTILVIDMPKGITGNKFDMALNVQWTPDGKKLLILTGDRYQLGSQDYDLLMWDATSGEMLSNMEIANQAVPESGDLSVSFVNYPTGGAIKISQQNGQLATLGGDNTAVIWDSAWKNPKLTLNGHTKGINSVDWSPDETKLVTASLDGTVLIWDTSTGEVLHTLTGHEGNVNLALWSPDGKQIASAGDDGILIVWNAKDGTLLRRIETNVGALSSLVWAPNSMRLISGHRDGNLRIWETDSGKLLETLRGHQGIVSDLKWSPIDDRLVSGDGNGYARIWNTAPSTAWRLYPPQAKRGGDWTIQGADWSKDGSNLVLAGGDPFGSTEPPSFSIWNVNENGLMMENLGDKLNFMGLEAHYSPDDQAILYLGFPSFPDFSGLATAYVFDAGTGEIIKTFTPGGEKLIRSVAWSPDGTQIATGTFNNEIIIWDYKTGKQITRLIHTPNQTSNQNMLFIDDVEWSPDGSKIAGVSGSVRVWDARTWALLFTTQHEAPAIVVGVVWSPDGKRLLTTAGNDEQGAKDTTARIWDAETGQEQVVLHGHTKSVWPGGWSPNGKRIVTFGNEGTVRIWDSTTGDELLTLSVPVLYGNFVWWSPDGKHLANVGTETLISIWNVWQSTDELIAYAKENYVFRQLNPAERQQYGLPAP